MNTRELFFRHLAQTSAAPLALEIVKAQGIMLFGADGRAYFDLIGGISVANTGHRHPRVVEAIRDQADHYLHLLVYGEMIQSPQVRYAAHLAQLLPASLDSIYFTNSGAEATEGAMKLAKRATGRTGICSFQFSYHGSTQGALSVMGDEYWRGAFRPLLPGIRRLEYGSQDDLDWINEETAAVIAETIQAERGVNIASADWMQALRRRCSQTGALLILDEIQTGFGRTGTLWGFEGFGIVPDILLLGKALGGGMPLGAFISARELMQTLSANPSLGHITTFGGHPVSCAAGQASLEVLIEEELVQQVKEKEKIFRERLNHPQIRSVRSCGLLLALEFDRFETNKRIIDRLLDHGFLTDWFLFAPHCLRLAPPLIISEEQIRESCAAILSCCDG
jgi:acetylornithine/N-succinyldiaminopimelate aminotransferase